MRSWKDVKENSSGFRKTDCLDTRQQNGDSPVDVIDVRLLWRKLQFSVVRLLEVYLNTSPFQSSFMKHLFREPLPLDFPSFNWAFINSETYSLLPWLLFSMLALIVFT